MLKAIHSAPVMDEYSEPVFKKNSHNLHMMPYYCNDEDYPECDELCMPPYTEDMYGIERYVDVFYVLPDVNMYLIPQVWCV